MVRLILILLLSISCFAEDHSEWNPVIKVPDRKLIINEPESSSISCDASSQLLVQKVWTSMYTRETIYCLDKSGWNSACLVMMKCNGEIIKVKDK